LKTIPFVLFKIILDNLINNIHYKE
jgi:hypothetical protein